MTNSERFIDVVIPPLSESFTYSIAGPLSESVIVGSRVEVPFGRRHASGFVVSSPSKIDTSAKPKFAIKAISKVISSYPWFDGAQLKFFQWIADYYGETLSTIIDLAIPPSVPARIEKSATLIAPVPENSRSKAQKEIANYLAKNPGANWNELSKLSKSAKASLKLMKERGLISVSERELVDLAEVSEAAPDWALKEVTLNEAQQESFESIVLAAQNKSFETFLLHGATGTGKTEVYLEAIRKLLPTKIGILVIVPEIALTPQLIDRFRARLGDDVAILHSGLHKRVRWESWRSLIERRQFVAIGARSGIFAPVPNLGLIIVDEEHDSSYKQGEGIRYNARDLAIVRGKLASCPVVLGSATPSLESWHNALTKKYHYVKLPGAAIGGYGSKVSVELVDMNQIKPWHMASRNISPALHSALIETIDRNEQAFILYNRRGFASYLQCEQCEAVVECPHCSVTLTFHQKNNSLLCHYCGYQTNDTSHCLKCANTKEGSKKPGVLIQRGAGTEKIFDEIKILFPTAVVDRLDRDSADDPGEYRKILDRVRTGKTQILVGTQMIAKGHDLPGVTLVGIADCDVGLHMPDFRAGERVFQLLTQAAGRAGRAEKSGKVILQTRVPKHLSLVTTAKRDYEAFARSELAMRRELNYPPFTRILRIIIAAESKILASDSANTMRVLIEQNLREAGMGAMILGPCPAPIFRLRNYWRHHILIKAVSASTLQRLMKPLREANVGKEVRVVLDLDPQDMM